MAVQIPSFIQNQPAGANPNVPNPPGGGSHPKTNPLRIILFIVSLLVIGGIAAYYFFIYSNDDTSENTNLVVVNNTNQNSNNNANSISNTNVSSLSNTATTTGSNNIVVANSNSVNNLNVSSEVNINSNSNIEGKTLVSDDVYSKDSTTLLGHSELFLPDGSFDTNMVIGINTFTWPMDPESRVDDWVIKNAIGGFYDFQNSFATNSGINTQEAGSIYNYEYLKPLTLKIFYTDDALGNKNEDDLKIYSTEFKLYKEYSNSIVNKQENSITVEIDRLGLFTIFEKSTRDLSQFDSDGDGYDDQTEIDNGFDPYK